MRTESLMSSMPVIRIATRPSAAACCFSLPRMLASKTTSKTGDL